MGKKRVVIGPDSNLTDDELERYIQQLREPLMVKPVKKNKGGGLNAAIKRVKKVQGMQEGGRTMSDADIARISNLPTEEFLSALGATFPLSGSGARIGSMLGGMAPRKRRMGMKPKGKMGKMGGGRTISDLDKVRLATLMGATDRQLMGMEEGGEVPKKFKGFSKLPEDVQQKMNPVAAAKYEDGGEVRGMGRAYRGAPRKVKIR